MIEVCKLQISALSGAKKKETGLEKELQDDAPAQNRVAKDNDDIVGSDGWHRSG